MASIPSVMPVLDAALCAFVRGGVSIGVATRDAALRAHAVRGVGARHDGARVVVLVPRGQAADTLADIAANGQVSVVFSQPATHRTYQLKGRDARTVAAGPEDRATALAYRDAFAASLEAVHHPRAFTEALLEGIDDGLVGVVFTPEAAFIATPGAQAGDPLHVPTTRPGRSESSREPRAPATSDPARVASPTAACEPTPQPPPADLHLDALRACFEGATPAMMATCAPDGTPNLTFLSQIQYVDPGHVALSFQFFNKTRANVLANPFSQVLVPHPETAAMLRLDLQYLRTETVGPLFEAMKAKLAGIASLTGMADVFVLRGADVYRVLAVARVTRGLPPSEPSTQRARPLAALRRTALRVAAATDLNALLDETLAALHDAFGWAHAMILLLDRRADRLFTVASRGYPSSGAGSEVPMGVGLIGTCARERTAIRINHLSAEYSYLRAVRESAERAGRLDRLETEIALPGLPAAHSQLAVPIVAAGSLFGVVFVESPLDRAFDYDDEDALVALGAQLGSTMPLLQSQQVRDTESEPLARPATDPVAPVLPVVPVAPDGLGPIAVRHYPHDDSVFLGDDYLIKGVAGQVLWLMARDHVEHGRTQFTNRELRLDPRLRLPDIGDNLEARLVLLQRRLTDRGACIRLEKTGRGRLRLDVTRALRLVDVR